LSILSTVGLKEGTDKEVNNAPQVVVISDRFAHTIDNLKWNVRANLRCLVDAELQTRMSVSDWHETHAEEEAKLGDYDNDKDKEAITVTTQNEGAARTFLFLNEEHNQSDITSLKNAQKLVEENPSMTTFVSVSSLDWSDENSFPKLVLPPKTTNFDSTSTSAYQKFDVLMGSDLVYDPVAANLLANAVSKLLHNNSESRFYYVAPTSGRAGVEKVHHALSERGMRIISVTEAPASYHENPFKRLPHSSCR
jgi:hypothetical protein